ncbi:MAG: 30S ribosomal protein S12 methylthiotransferase RimO [Endomicrobium sp.]|jgi:ribosomal protein S12 methylthiotransferase|nr:30S ribosomal protein S12 methylthiotransferase RimO [Endomicrobium sp.]
MSFAPYKVALVALGCPKNTVESEYMLGAFKAGGLTIVGDINRADIIVVHTCSFIKAAKEESERCVEQALSLKKTKDVKVFVTGCLPQLLKEEILKIFPLIDGYLGTGDLKKLPELFFGAAKSCADAAGGLNNSKNRLLSSPLPYAYLKIAEGCNHKCSFCIIPDLRGTYKSRTLNSLVEEAGALAQAGIKELIIVAQDTSSFGIDLYNRFSLDKLLSKLSAVKSLKWIRLMYAYPSSVTDGLIDVIKEYANICRYMDIPVQHASKKILSAMKRPVNSAAVIKKIKSKIPGITLRTSFITGFPGETDKDAAELVDFVKEGYFRFAGVFQYCDQEKAASSKLKGKVSQRIAAARRILIENAQYGVFKSEIDSLKNTEIEFMAESCSKSDCGYAVKGRSAFHAPEIDGNIVVSHCSPLIAGNFYKAVIKGNNGYDIKALIKE